MPFLPYLILLNRPDNSCTIPGAHWCMEERSGAHSESIQNRAETSRVEGNEGSISPCIPWWYTNSVLWTWGLLLSILDFLLSSIPPAFRNPYTRTLRLGLWLRSGSEAGERRRREEERTVCLTARFVESMASVSISMLAWTFSLCYECNSAWRVQRTGAKECRSVI